MWCRRLRGGTMRSARAGQATRRCSAMPCTLPRRTASRCMRLITWAMSSRIGGVSTRRCLASARTESPILRRASESRLPELTLTSGQASLITLRDIVASRRDFLTAVAAVFRAQYPREDETRPSARSTRSSSPSTRTSTGISPRFGTMLPEGGIRVYFSAYELALVRRRRLYPDVDARSANPGLFKVRWILWQSKTIHQIT